MKERTKKLLEQVDQHHDWLNGQVWSGGGLELHSTDTCRICGLRRHWRDDRQNGPRNEYRFSRGEQDIVLADAVDCR